MNDAFSKKIYDKFLISTIFALTGNVAGAFVNNIVIGRLLGTSLLIVPSLTTPLYYVFASIGALIGVGGMSVCASLIGEHDYDNCKSAFTITWIITAVTAIILTLVSLLFLDNILNFLGVPSEVYAETKSYAYVISISGFFIMGIYPVFNLLRLDGRTVMAVLVFAVQAIATILFDIIFVYVFDTGVLGAGIAVYGGSAVAVIFGLYVFLLPGGSGGLCFVRIKILKEIAVIKRIFVVGFPSAVENICILLKMIFLNLILIKGFGVMSVSAFMIVSSLNSIALIFIAGVSGTTMAFNSVFFAERDTLSIRQIVNRAFLVGNICLAVFTIGCILFPAEITSIFGMTSNSEAMPLIVTAITIYSISFLPALVNNILICLYQSTGRPLFANIMNFSRGLFFIVLVSVLFSGTFGVEAIWHSFWIGEVMTLIIAIVVGEIIRNKNRNVLSVYLLDVSAEQNGNSLAFSVTEKISEPENDGVEIMRVTKEIESAFVNFPNKKIASGVTHAVEEMLVMIKERNFGGVDFNASGRILITENTTDELPEIVLSIRNFGKIYNPISDYDEDDLSFLGLRMIMKMSKSIDYQRVFGANNLTIII